MLVIEAITLVIANGRPTLRGLQATFSTNTSE